MATTVEIVIKGKDQASGAFRSANNAAGGLAGTLAKIGGAAIKAGLFAAAGAATALGVGLAGCIGPASDLNETISKVGIVFGKQADKILKFGETSARALGMSKNEALSAAGTYGNLFRSMGMTEEASAGMSTSLVQLAADLGSFNNIPTAEALEKLRAGLTGETEPLRSLGVNLNEAAIKAKAMAMGLYSGKGALDASAKAQASYALIMEQTSLAQGDFERTSSGLANQQKILGSIFEDIKAKIGTALLPLLTKLAGKLSETLAKPETQAAIQKVADAIEDIATGLGDIVKGFGLLREGDFGSFVELLANGLYSIGEALGISRPKLLAFTDAIFKAAFFIKEKAIPAVTDFANFVGENLTPILAGLGAMILTTVVPAFIAWTAAAIPLAIANAAAMAPILAAAAPILAIGVAVGLLAAAWTKDWGGIRTTITRVWEGTIKPALGKLWQWLSVELPLAALKVKIWLTKTWEDIKGAVSRFWTGVVGIFAGIKNWFTVTLPNAVNEFKRKIVDAFNSVKERISSFVQGIVNWFTVVLPGTLKAFWQRVVNFVTMIGASLAGGFNTVKETIARIWTGIWDWVGNFLRAAWDTIRIIVVTALILFLDMFGVKLEDIVAWWTGTWAKIQLYAAAVWVAIKDIINEGIERVRAWITLKLAEIEAKWAAVWYAVKDAASQIWNKISLAINEGIERVRAWITLKLAEIEAKWAAVWYAVKDAASQIWDKISSKAREIFETIRAWIAEKAEDIKNFLAQTWETIKLKVSLTWDAILAVIKDLVGKIITAIKGKAEEIKNNIVNPIVNAKNAIVAKLGEFYNTGADLIKSLIDGAKAWAQRLLDAILSPIKDAIDRAKRLLGIRDSSAKSSAAMAEAVTAAAAQGISVAVAGLQVQAAGGGGVGGSGTVEYHLHIHTSATTENLIADFAMLQAMAG